MDFKVKLLLKSETIPKFCKAVSVAFAIKGAIEGELDRLEATGIVERVTHHDRAAPAPKKDGGFHTCEDYKVTVNGALDVDQYSLPNPSELFATQTYQQLLLDQEST